MSTRHCRRGSRRASPSRSRDRGTANRPARNPALGRLDNHNTSNGTHNSPPLYSPSRRRPGSPSRYARRYYSTTGYSPESYSPGHYSPGPYSPSLYTGRYSPGRYSPVSYSPPSYSRMGYDRTSSNTYSLPPSSAGHGTGASPFAMSDASTQVDSASASASLLSPLHNYYRDDLRASASTTPRPRSRHRSPSPFRLPSPIPSYYGDGDYGDRTDYHPRRPSDTPSWGATRRDDVDPWPDAASSASTEISYHSPPPRGTADYSPVGSDTSAWGWGYWSPGMEERTFHTPRATPARGQWSPQTI